MLIQKVRVIRNSQQHHHYTKYLTNTIPFEYEHMHIAIKKNQNRDLLPTRYFSEG
jgi:hypothetical protein